MQHILFICEANSIRSQLAEALARDKWRNRNVLIESAGRFVGSGVNPYVQQVLQGMGLDCSQQFSKIYTSIKNPHLITHVVILCTQDFLGDYFANAAKLHYPLPLPPVVASDAKATLGGYRKLVSQIKHMLTKIKL